MMAVAVTTEAAPSATVPARAPPARPVRRPAPAPGRAGGHRLAGGLPGRLRLAGGLGGLPLRRQRLDRRLLGPARVPLQLPGLRLGGAAALGRHVGPVRGAGRGGGRDRPRRLLPVLRGGVHGRLHLRVPAGAGPLPGQLLPVVPAGVAAGRRPRPPALVGRCCAAARPALRHRARVGAVAAARPGRDRLRLRHLAKLNSDWRAGEPLRTWLAARPDLPLLGHWSHEEWMWRRTRIPALCAAVLFTWPTGSCSASGCSCTWRWPGCCCARRRGHATCLAGWPSGSAEWTVRRPPSGLARCPARPCRPGGAAAGAAAPPPVHRRPGLDRGRAHRRLAHDAAGQVGRGQLRGARPLVGTELDGRPGDHPHHLATGQDGDSRASSRSAG
jgi:hypothetical protein